MNNEEPDAQHSGRYGHAYDDEEIDELASTSLLDTHDKESGASSTRNSSPRSALSQTEDALKMKRSTAKPLPLLPSSAHLQKMDKNNAKRPVLGAKSTNMKVANKTSKIPTKPQISPPILISSSMDPFEGVAGHARSPAAEQAHIDKKIFHLQQQADAQAAETREKEKRLAAIEASFRPSPLQRGKSVLMTAKRAITSRIGSPKIKLGRTKNPLNRTLSGLEYGSIGRPSNLATASHRPLPVYESMRTRRETPEPQEGRDPFSDAMETNEAWSDFEFDFDRRKVKPGSRGNTSSSHMPSVDVLQDPASEKLVVQSKTPISFSNKISGLRQHPDAEFFSSSPVGFSTPRVRLAPTCDENGKKRLSTVLVRDPSSLDFSLEQEHTDEDGDPLVLDYNKVEPSSSMKRKSATEDLRFQGSKRAKTDSATSNETTVLVQGFGQLGANDVQAMEGVELNPGDGSIRSDTSNSKGFGIFDMGNGKETEARIESSAGYSSIRRHSRALSTSSSRPTSVLFSRESRARVPLLETHKDDEMDVDELQMGK